jgi:hypothetical protein
VTRTHILLAGAITVGVLAIAFTLGHAGGGPPAAQAEKLRTPTALEQPAQPRLRTLGPAAPVPALRKPPRKSADEPNNSPTPVPDAQPSPPPTTDPATPPAPQPIPDPGPAPGPGSGDEEIIIG